MKHGTLRFIPLQSDLCLNKQKVDIEDFKGWQKCNAPVYGDCLSPLYKKDDTHHDIFVGNDVYDFENGVLKKNGIAVLSGTGSKKLKKTKTLIDYNAMAVSDSGALTWVKETGGNSVLYSLNGSTAAPKTLANALSIVQTKAFANDTYSIYGIIILYLHTNGKYGYYISWSDNGTTHETYGEDSPTLWQNFDVVSPLIQVGVFASGKFMVSFFGTSGANISGTDVRNVFVDSGNVYTNPTFIDTGLGTTRYKVIDNSFGINVSINSYTITGLDAAPVQTAAWKGALYRQDIRISLNKALASNISLTFFYQDASGTIHNKRTITIPAGQTSFTTSTNVVFAFYAPLIGNTKSREWFMRDDVNEYTRNTLPSDFFLFPCYVTSNVMSSVGYSVSYLSDAAPNNVDLPQNLVTTTVTLPLKCTKGTTYYNCPGLTLNSLSKEIGGNNLLYNNWSDDHNAKDFYSALYTQGVLSSPGQAKNCGAVFDGADARLTVLNKTGTFDVTGFTCNAPSMPPQIVTNSAVAVNVTGGYATEYAFGKQAYSEAGLKDVDCCLDDGLFYTVGDMYNNPDEPLPTKLFALSGAFNNFNPTTKTINYNSTSVFNIVYDANPDTNVFPKYYCGKNISLTNNYYRGLYKFKAKATDEKFIDIMIDSLGIAEGRAAAHLYPGVQDGTDINNQGGVKNTKNTHGWRIVFNNNMISNVACYEDKDYIGTILADWFTLDDTFCIAYNDNVLYYRDNQSNVWKIEMLTEGQDWDYKYIEERFIVLNTTNYFNCYDTKTGLKRHWASDYNNRVMFGYAFSSYVNNDTFKTLLQAELFRGLIVTGQNANYEMTDDSISSIELGAMLYEQCLKDNYDFISCGTPYGAVEGVDLYRGDGDSTSALYINSFLNGLKYIDNDLINPYAIYPISQNGDVRYNPNLFTQFIRSYNNKDMVVSDGIAYRLVYYNNVIPIMSYFMLDGVEELIGAFVLQTSYYGVSNTRLYQMNYSNGVGVEVVADITNLEYLGALPTQALFWSAQNRAIYSFQGNCIMQLRQYANELTGIFGKWYNPATQELFLDTNIGILVFSDLGTYCLEWENETTERTIKDIFFFEDYFIINLYETTEEPQSHYYSYNNKDGYVSNGVYFLTKYYGNGLVPITVNNIYIRLYNQSVENAEGNITMKGHTITDIGTQTDTKEVVIGGVDPVTEEPVGEEWDAETGTMLIKYTPQYNRGLGFALEVATTFPIIDIKFDYVENGSVESQIAHINI